jgi:hypothetical protein
LFSIFKDRFKAFATTVGFTVFTAKSTLSEPKGPKIAKSPNKTFVS